MEEQSVCLWSDYSSQQTGLQESHRHETFQLLHNDPAADSSFASAEDIMSTNRDISLHCVRFYSQDCWVECEARHDLQPASGHDTRSHASESVMSSHRLWGCCSTELGLILSLSGATAAGGKHKKHRGAVEADDFDMKRSANKALQLACIQTGVKEMSAESCIGS